jgi:hypothetical protein
MHPGCDWRCQVDPKPENDSRELAVQFVTSLMGAEVLGEIVTTRSDVAPHTTADAPAGLCLVCGALACLRTPDGRRWAHPACGVPAVEYDLADLYELDPGLEREYLEFVGLRLPAAAGRADVVTALGDVLDALPGDLPVLAKVDGQVWATRWSVRGGMDVIYDVRRVLGPGTVTMRRSLR